MSFCVLSKPKRVSFNQTVIKTRAVTKALVGELKCVSVYMLAYVHKYGRRRRVYAARKCLFFMFYDAIRLMHCLVPTWGNRLRFVEVVICSLKPTPEKHSLHTVNQPVTFRNIVSVAPTVSPSNHRFPTLLYC